MKFLGKVCGTFATVTLLAACGASTGGTQTTPTASSPTPSPSPLACSTSGAASASWPGASAATSTPPIISAVVAGDTLTLTFTQGTPAFEVKTQSGTRFLKDPSGQAVDLAGTAGVTIVLRGFRGDIRNYTGPASITSSGPRLLQVYEIGDFEGVVTWAAGLSTAGCASVTASGSTLTFQFIAQPS